MRKLICIFVSISWFSSFAQFKEGKGYVEAEFLTGSTINLFKGDLFYERVKPWLTVSYAAIVHAGYSAEVNKNWYLGGGAGFRYTSFNYEDSEFRDAFGVVQDYRPLSTHRLYIQVGPEASFCREYARKRSFEIKTILLVLLPFEASTKAETFDSRPFSSDDFNSTKYNQLINYSVAIEPSLLFGDWSLGLNGAFIFATGYEGKELLGGWNAGLSAGYNF